MDIDQLKDIVFYKIFNAYINNYAILKSNKFKKMVFSFSGETNFIQVLSQIILTDMVEFENETNIKVHKSFYYIFNLTKNDIFSESILNEIKSNKDYQIIFTGHSLGGAVVTLALYYFAKNRLSQNEHI